jgi:hypothetical protein
VNAWFLHCIAVLQHHDAVAGVMCNTGHTPCA